MRKYLAKLPTVAQIGEGLFLQSDISTMQEASSHYAGMTGYQEITASPARNRHSGRLW